MSKFNELVNKMTNHARNIWAGAGYPGLDKKVSDEEEAIRQLQPYLPKEYRNA